jgi:hypothetical protein
MLGTIFYVILQFWTFKDHDYYTLNLYILLIINIVTFAWMMYNQYPRIFHSKYVQIVFFLFFVINVAHAKNQMRERYNGWWNDHPKYKNYDTVTPYLRSIGIQPLDTVICLPDYSHYTLYLMNQRGWTECMGNNQDSTGIVSNIKKGAKYLIVNGNEVLSCDYIQGFLYDPIGQYGNIKIFKLGKVRPIIKPNNVKEQLEKITCGAETLSRDGKYFKADSSDALLEGGQCQNTKKVYSGKYSACLTPEKAFAMTYRFKDVGPGEHYTITVLRWAAQGNGLLVASTTGSKEFLLNKPNKIEKLQDGWEKLTLDFYVNFKPVDGQLGIYLWNEGKAPVYFDDLTIVRRYVANK